MKGYQIIKIVVHFSTFFFLDLVVGQLVKMYFEAEYYFFDETAMTTAFVRSIILTMFIFGKYYSFMTIRSTQKQRIMATLEKLGYFEASFDGIEHVYNRTPKTWWEGPVDITLVEGNNSFLLQIPRHYEKYFQLNE